MLNFVHSFLPFSSLFFFFFFLGTVHAAPIHHTNLYFSSSLQPQIKPLLLRIKGFKTLKPHIFHFTNSHQIGSIFMAVKCQQNNVVSFFLFPLSLNGQISHRHEWNDHFENGIKLGGSK